MINNLLETLEKDGYEELREVPNRGVCGLYRFLFTYGLVFGCDEIGYRGRYCYHSKAEASIALKYWDGVDDPVGNWIKYKGEGGERSNPQHEKYSNNEIL